jgi:hypothetical protein
MPDPSSDLQQRIAEWLRSEGYPLEFRAANDMFKLGFSVRQGYYVKDPKVGMSREIDVLAEHTLHKECIRIYYVIECKWSVDKPWVVFTSPRTTMSQAACINHAIASILGKAIVWVIAGDSDLANTALFATPERGGFGGRQVFGKSNDLFYSSVQSVITNSTWLVREYDQKWRLIDKNARVGCSCFPHLSRARTTIRIVH